MAQPANMPAASANPDDPGPIVTRENQLMKVVL